MAFRCECRWAMGMREDGLAVGVTIEDAELEVQSLA